MSKTSQRRVSTSDRMRKIIKAGEQGKRFPFPTFNNYEWKKYIKGLNKYYEKLEKEIN